MEHFLGFKNCINFLCAITFMDEFCYFFFYRFHWQKTFGFGLGKIMYYVLGILDGKNPRIKDDKCVDNFWLLLLVN